MVPAISRVEALPIGSRLSVLVTEAEAEIARFDSTIGARLAGYITLALRTEAAASSQIENLTVSPQAVAIVQARGGTAPGISPNAHMVVNNVDALVAAIGITDAPGIPDIERMRAMLLADRPHLVGIRNQQVWIGGSASSPHGAVYVAPHHERVPDAMADLSSFIARDDLGSLPHVAIAHAQFESIHPFPDGNGRTGRALVQRMLRADGLVRESLIPLSAGLLTDIAGYFAALEAYRDGDVEPIVETFVESAITAMDNSRQLAADLAEIRTAWNDQIEARSGSTAWILADLCATHGAVSVALARDTLGVSVSTAEPAIETLEGAGILRQSSSARQNRVWLAPEVIAALDAFVARSGRLR